MMCDRPMIEGRGGAAQNLCKRPVYRVRRDGRSSRAGQNPLSESASPLYAPMDAGLFRLVFLGTCWITISTVKAY